MAVNDNGDAINVTLHLDNLGELFAAPLFDPFSQQSRVESGMDEIANHLRTRRLKSPPRINATLILPAEYVAVNDVEPTHRAIGRYCDLHITKATTIKKSRRYEGISKLGTGLLALPAVAVLIALISLVT